MTDQPKAQYTSFDGLGRDLRDTIERMEIGQAVRFAYEVIEAAYPPHEWDGFFGRGSPLDRLMEGIVGANFCYRVIEQNLMDHTVTILRVPETGKRWRVDYDRRHLFKQQPDGSYEVIHDRL